MDGRKAKLAQVIRFALTWKMLLSGEIAKTLLVGLEKTLCPTNLKEAQSL